MYVSVAELVALRLEGSVGCGPVLWFWDHSQCLLCRWLRTLLWQEQQWQLLAFARTLCLAVPSQVRDA